MKISNKTIEVYEFSRNELEDICRKLYNIGYDSAYKQGHKNFGKGDYSLSRNREENIKEFLDREIEEHFQEEL